MPKNIETNIFNSLNKEGKKMASLEELSNLVQQLQIQVIKHQQYILIFEDNLNNTKRELSETKEELKKANEKTSVQNIIFDAAKDFSATDNPIGPWTYGYSTNLSGTFVKYTNLRTVNGLNYWNSRSEGEMCPCVSHNGTHGTTILFGTVKLHPEQMAFHPGPNGEYSIVRWTAPAGGSYDVSATFSGADFHGPTSTDVHVLINGREIFSGNVNGYGSISEMCYLQTVALKAGNTIDFAVGYGNNSNYFCDTTALKVVIKAANTRG